MKDPCVMLDRQGSVDHSQAFVIREQSPSHHG